MASLSLRRTGWVPKAAATLGIANGSPPERAIHAVLVNYVRLCLSRKSSVFHITRAAAFAALLQYERICKHDKWLKMLKIQEWLILREHTFRFNIKELSLQLSLLCLNNVSQAHVNQMWSRLRAPVLPAHKARGTDRGPCWRMPEHRGQNKPHPGHNSGCFEFIFAKRGAGRTSAVSQRRWSYGTTNVLKIRLKYQL